MEDEGLSPGLGHGFWGFGFGVGGFGFLVWDFGFRIRGTDTFSCMRRIPARRAYTEFARRTQETMDGRRHFLNQNHQLSPNFHRFCNSLLATDAPRRCCPRTFSVHHVFIIFVANFSAHRSHTPTPRAQEKSRLEVSVPAPSTFVNFSSFLRCSPDAPTPRGSAPPRRRARMATWPPPSRGPRTGRVSRHFLYLRLFELTFFTSAVSLCKFFTGSAILPHVFTISAETPRGDERGWRHGRHHPVVRGTVV
jgi:hypothetical protein